MSGDATLAPLSTRSPEQSTAQSIRRILRELKEIRQNASPLWTANPIDFNEPYEWHFTLRGPPGSVFEEGIYHGRLILPLTYPMSPPSLQFLTPNGRFEVQKPVCLSASNYHPESWQPAWGIRSMLEALVAFMPSPAEGAVGAVDLPDHVRRQLAKQSLAFCCPTCRRSNLQIMTTHRAQETDQTSAAEATGTTNSPSIDRGVVSGSASGTANGGAAGTVGGSVSDAATETVGLTNLSDAPVDPAAAEHERLEDIRRRRTAPLEMSIKGRMATATSRFRPGTPIFCIFLYWLVFFMSQSLWQSLQRRFMSRGGSWAANPRRHLVLLTLLVVGAVSALRLLFYFRRVFADTFFLFDIPFDQSPQSVTNPSASDMLKPLSIAQRTEDFELHPWIVQIVRAFQTI